MKCPNDGVEFTPVKRNQKYCSKRCAKEVSNEKTKARYHENKEVKQKKCSKCESPLSKYNDTDTCSLCVAKKRNRGDIDMSKVVWD